MALQATTIKLRERARDRAGAEAFYSYLSELEVVEVSPARVVLRVAPTLAREAFRRCGSALCAVSKELFGSRNVVLAGDDEWFDLEQGTAHRSRAPAPGVSSTASGSSRAPVRVRQRSGPCGQPGTRERLAAQKTFRVPFAVAASLPRTASQAFGRHSPEEPLKYVGRWGKAYGEETLTPFHHRLLLGALRLAQAGCLTDQGVACSINLLLHAAEGKGSRELPVARDQVLPALMNLLACNASYTAHHVAEHTGEPYIASQRKLKQPILKDVLVRSAEHPDRVVSLSEIMIRREDGRYEQTVELARGGGASVLLVFAGWVLDALAAPADQAGTLFVVLDTPTFLSVGSRRLFAWLAILTAPALSAGERLPEKVPRPPQNTVYKRIDLNYKSVRDFGRHGHDLDRICEDVREDVCGEHGIAAIDRRVHSAHAIWSGGVLQLWVCWRSARDLPHRGGLPRRLAARRRWLGRSHVAPAATGRRRRCRERTSTAGQTARANGVQAGRGVPRIVALARSQTASGDDGDA
jgi:hypothetical protein